MLLAISPWADADVLYVRTGERNRAGFAAAAGVLVPVGVARAFWIGPFVRYFQIMQRERPGVDDSDAKILSMGVSLEVGLGVERRRAGAAACQACGIDDMTDNVDGGQVAEAPVQNWGCPGYKRLVIRHDKRELKEKLYFAWDQAVLQEDSFAVLDEVVRILNGNRGFRLQVEGHASSEGASDHNQALSEQRADAVLNYLVEHGIDRRRLYAKGFGSSVSLGSSSTVAGPNKDRRVELVIYFTILAEGSE